MKSKPYQQKCFIYAEAVSMFQVNCIFAFLNFLKNNNEVGGYIYFKEYWVNHKLPNEYKKLAEIYGIQLLYSKRELREKRIAEKRKFKQFYLATVPKNPFASYQSVVIDDGVGSYRTNYSVWRDILNKEAKKTGVNAIGVLQKLKLFLKTRLIKYNYFNLFNRFCIFVNSGSKHIIVNQDLADNYKAIMEQLTKTQKTYNHQQKILLYLPHGVVDKHENALNLAIMQKLRIYCNNHNLSLKVKPHISSQYAYDENELINISGTVEEFFYTNQKEIKMVVGTVSTALWLSKGFFNIDTFRLPGYALKDENIEAIFSKFIPYFDAEKS